MSLLIAFLTFVLVVNCLFLMLLVLVQLPKKEACAGLAFGAGAVDTLIGAGSGNALTKMTKYSAGIFLGLAVVIAILNTQRHQSSAGYLKEELSRRTTTPATAPVLPQQPAATPTSGQLPATDVTPATQPATGPTLQLTPQPAPQQSATPGTVTLNTTPAATQQQPAATPAPAPTDPATKQP